MDCQIRIEFDREGIEGIEGTLKGITVPHILPYMPRIGEFTFDPSGLMGDEAQRTLYHKMEDQLGTTCVSNIIVSFKDNMQEIILVLAFEKDYQQIIRWEAQDRQAILQGKGRSS